MFDVTKPDDFNIALKLLIDRTIGTFKVAHTLLMDNKYHCLDLDITADSIDDLTNQIVAKVAQMNKNDVLPIGNTDLWRFFVLGELVSQDIKVIKVPGAGRKGLVIIAVRAYAN